MKKRLTLIIFILFVVLGIVMGKNLGDGTSPFALNHSNLRPNQPYNSSAPTSVPWQENFVVVIVDQISNEAKVDSIWYLMIDKEINKRTMISLYPQKTDQKETTSEAQPMLINAKDVKSAINLEVITSNRLTIDHVLIVDETFADALIAMGEDIVINEVPYQTFSGIMEIALAWEDPNRSLDNQLAVLLNICGTNYGVEGKNLFQTEGFEKHVVTTTSLSDLNARWNEMVLTTPGNYCEILIGS